MRRLFLRAYLLAATVCIWTAPLAAQQQTFPPNTVYGRLGAGTSGPGQSIPFATLLSVLSQTTSSGNSLAITNGNGPAGKGLHLNASPTGSDTNNNCMNAGTPCTLMGACLVRSQIATFITNGLTILLADGTYSATDSFGALCSIIGNAGGSSSKLTNITGDCVTPANVILAIPANSTGIFTKDAGEAEISCIDFTGGNGSVGISAAQFSIVDYETVLWGSWGTGGLHIQGSLGAAVNCLGPETINAGISTHWSISSGANLTAGCVTTIPSAVAWAAQFLFAQNPATINLSGWSTTGSGVAGTTGKRATLVGPGFMIGNGVACNTLLPGNAACTLTNDFQDDANDPATSPIVQAQFTIGTLPTCNSAVQGTLAYVTNGVASPTYRASVSTTGSTLQLVGCDGSGWTYH